MPLHNEAPNVPAVAEELLTTLRSHDFVPSLLFVDDGSTDNSLNVIEELSRNEEAVDFISFSRNFGKEAAILAGLRECGDDFDVVAYMDSDGQHRPSDLIRLLEVAKTHDVHIVSGTRTDRNYQSVVSRLLARLFYSVFKMIASREIPEGVGDFNVLRPDVVAVLRGMDEDRPFLKGLLAWVGFKNEPVPITIRSRPHGEAKMSPLGLAKLSINALISFSSWPLRTWSIIGIACAFLSISYLTLVIIQTAIYGRDVPGYATTVVLLLGLGGLQLLSVGILGEYVGRIYDATKNRPRYIVAKRSKAKIDE